jgi:NAD(P)-dependent dehydrogenase (short-subunit alcohol dehydrogenase family)
MLEFENKNALVTGASRGIGRATALMLARAGANVLVHYGRSAHEAGDGLQGRRTWQGVFALCSPMSAGAANVICPTAGACRR